jgi:hypothetical protein
MHALNYQWLNGEIEAEFSRSKTVSKIENFGAYTWLTNQKYVTDVVSVIPYR